MIYECGKNNKEPKKYRATGPARKEEKDKRPKGPKGGGVENRRRGRLGRRTWPEPLRKGPEGAPDAQGEGGGGEGIVRRAERGRRRRGEIGREKSAFPSAPDAPDASKRLTRQLILLADRPNNLSHQSADMT